MGEDAKDWEREESEGGGFEAEALVFIATERRVERVATCRSHEPKQNASRLFASSCP